jgi:hypothetical protein
VGLARVTGLAGLLLSILRRPLTERERFRLALLGGPGWRN